MGMVQVKAAMGAVERLHGAPPQQGPAIEQPAKRQKKGKLDDSNTDGAVEQPLWARQVAGEGALMKKWRVIIRNLPFQVQLLDAHLSTGPDGCHPV